MALATPVSSSRLRKTKPLAVPGRWRAMTHPPIRTYFPLECRRGRWLCELLWHPCVRDDRPWDAGPQSCRCRESRPPTAPPDSWDAAGIWHQAREVRRAAARSAGRHARFARGHRGDEERLKISDWRFQMVGSCNLQSRICILKFFSISLWCPADGIQSSDFRQRIQFVLA